jgi:hypothetical protein
MEYPQRWDVLTDKNNTLYWVQITIITNHHTLILVAGGRQ